MAVIKSDIIETAKSNRLLRPYEGGGVVRVLTFSATSENNIAANDVVNIWHLKGECQLLMGLSVVFSTEAAFVHAGNTFQLNIPAHKNSLGKDVAAWSSATFAVDVNTKKAVPFEKRVFISSPDVVPINLKVVGVNGAWKSLAGTLGYVAG